ncbi:PREDICTED: BMP-binding endothelial regulator protein-like [Ceratosolen solmsi marchali]|uniref:BMP-binding endothelial regulator protein-like n=1 Tax=Ceratosolen solmsi marchali TaxID=326594 RepID=A0AAJ6YQT8_9HYME|nr:PREDICTED: BMP-binding endothelial regulator protein-like [Ceratosolen solmsi marchali]
MNFIVCLFIFLCISHQGIVYAEIEGSQETCNIEDESIAVTTISNMNCFNCICKKGFVECEKQKCPSIEGCYVLERKQQMEECCQKCKGCIKNGVYHDSETEWIESTDPCKLLKCLAGIITEAVIHCYIPCENPTSISGQCCPTCSDCHINEKKIFKETRIISEKDPCVSCNCILGKLICIKRTCPVLNCPKSKIFNNFEDCCPKCLGTGKLMDPPKGACLLGTVIYQSGTYFNLSNCVYCNCKDSTIYCQKKSCPIMKCKREYQEILPGRCCAQCKNIQKHTNDNFVNEDESIEMNISGNGSENDDQWNKEDSIEKKITKEELENQSKCTHAEKIYKNGAIWNTTNCKICTCIQSKINCTTLMCPAISCRPNSVLKIPRGQCCPQCIESHGVCTVFGGMYFRTFDRKMYTFIGSCKYQLATDCESATFNIQLENIVLGNDATIKQVSLNIGHVKVDLQQNRNTKINNKIVDLPYHSKKKLDIFKNHENIIIISKLGIKINWYYKGFLEIIVSKNYRKKMCGLCGNFNSIIADDLTTQEGILVEDPAIFAQSWTVGDQFCLETRKYGIQDCNLRKNQRLCNYIKGSVFEKCLKKINVTSYYEKCLQDMCHCSPEDLQCHCESFTNYVRDCRRLGILLPRWRKSVGC